VCRWEADRAVERDPGTPTMRRSLIGTIWGDETFRRTNKKPTRAYSHAFGINGDVRNQGWCELHGNRMGSEGRSCSSRGCARSETLTWVSASESFAPVRVVWICALWALMHSIFASKQVKDLAHRISGSRYRDDLYRLTFNAQSVVSLLWAARRFSQLPDRELLYPVVREGRNATMHSLVPCTGITQISKREVANGGKV
jgi:hypothetical protein